MAQPPALHLESLEVGYRDGPPGRRRTATILDNVSVNARAGELTALIGPNGIGKSTLLRTVCGLQPPLAGSCRLADGIAVHGLGARELATRIAVVLTDRPDPGLLDGRGVVALGRTPHLDFHGHLAGSDHDVIDRSLAAVGAEHLADRAFTALSDGEKQRILTARALCQEPQILVLDEPTSFLDVPSRVELVDMLRTLAETEDIAVVMSTHDLELALRVVHHVWLVTGDREVRQGSPRALANSGLIGATFDRGRMRFDPASQAFMLDLPLATR